MFSPRKLVRLTGTSTKSDVSSVLNSPCSSVKTANVNIRYDELLVYELLVSHFQIRLATIITSLPKNTHTTNFSPVDSVVINLECFSGIFFNISSISIRLNVGSIGLYNVSLTAVNLLAVFPLGTDSSLE